MLWNMKEATLTLGDSTMDYVTFGRGTRPLVIIPGLSLRDVKGAGAGLAWMYRRFAKEYRVYVPDKKSDIPAGYTVRDIANDTAEAMRQWGITDACVVGISLGGMVAQYLALDHPELVSRLVLGVTAPCPNETMRGVIDHWVAQAERDDFAAIIKDMSVLMYSEAYVKRYKWLFPLLAKVGVPKNKERFVNLARACLTCDTYAVLDQIRCETLVLGGEEDKIVTGTASWQMAERIGCEIRMYDGLGHAAYEEAADFNQRIYEFLNCPTEESDASLEKEAEVS